MSGMRVLLLAGCLIAAAGPALAADLPVAPPPQAPAAYVPAVAPIYNWSGIYLGVNVGASFVNQGVANNTVATGPLAGTIIPGFSTSSTGIAGGGQIGINLQNGPWVYGLEGDADYLSNKSTTYGTSGGTEQHVFSLDLLSTVRGRIGYAFDRALFYGTGGLAMSEYSVQRTQLTGLVGAAGPGTVETYSTLRLGWAAGGGIEYGLGQNWTARIEYLFADLESLTYTFPIANRTQAAPDEYVNLVRAGLNFKFGGF
jgi:outer membrane immunogenic protein